MSIKLIRYLLCKLEPQMTQEEKNTFEPFLKNPISSRVLNIIVQEECEHLLDNIDKHTADIVDMQSIQDASKREVTRLQPKENAAHDEPLPTE